MFQNATLSKTALYTKNRITIYRDRLNAEEFSPATLHPVEAYSEGHSVGSGGGELDTGAATGCCRAVVHTYTRCCFLLIGYI